MERDDEIVVTRRAALALLLGLAACAGGTGASPVTMGRAAKLQPTGWVGPGLEVFDRVVLDAMERGRIPGASLAIAHRGRLVLARGYGVADVETGARVEPETLFMLASVSKSLTAATILKQVEQGRLALDARVVDVLDYLRPPGGELRDPRWREITIEMLLYHEGGWDRTTRGTRSRGRSASRAPCTCARRCRPRCSRATCWVSRSTSLPARKPSTPTSATCCSGSWSSA